eukprot:8197268-Karenia_brevis.AAC.1
MRNGMLLVLCPQMNKEWVHGIPPASEPGGRISITRWGVGRCARDDPAKLVKFMDTHKCAPRCRTLSPVGQEDFF